MADHRLDGTEWLVRGTDAPDVRAEACVDELWRAVFKSRVPTRAWRVVLEILALCVDPAEFEGEGVPLLKTAFDEGSAEYASLLAVLRTFYQRSHGKYRGDVLEEIVARRCSAKHIGASGGRLLKLRHASLHRVTDGTSVCKNGETKVDHAWVGRQPRWVGWIECKISLDHSDDRVRRQFRYLAACRLATRLAGLRSTAVVISLDKRCRLPVMPGVTHRLDWRGWDFVVGLMSP